MAQPKPSAWIYPGLHYNTMHHIKRGAQINRGELEIVAATCCEEYDLTLDEFKSRLKTETLSDARKIFFLLCREYLYKFTCKRLGMYVGRDHSTVTVAVQRANELLKVDPAFRVKFNNVKQRARQRLRLNGYQYKGSENLTNDGTRDKRLPSLESTNCREGSSYAATTVGELNC